MLLICSARTKVDNGGVWCTRICSDFFQEFCFFSGKFMEMYCWFFGIGLEFYSATKMLVITRVVEWNCSCQNDANDQKKHTKTPVCYFLVKLIFQYKSKTLKFFKIHISIFIQIITKLEDGFKNVHHFMLIS